MKRIYHALVKEHINDYDQMIFLAGPRQVGKTTIAMESRKLALFSEVLNWDKLHDREKIIGNIDFFKNLPQDILSDKKPIIIFDEIHKYQHWKTFLKGIIDEYKQKLHVIVTGSCKLDVYRKEGDSLMGRYFLYRIHPFSVAELIRDSLPEQVISKPQKLADEVFDSLLIFGGFPEPLKKGSKRFYNRWQNLRRQQLVKEDIRDLAQIQEIGQLELLSYMLQAQSGQLLNYTSLANKIRVSDQTIRRWITILESYYYCFTIRPWSKNIGRSLLKEPKIYLWDWSIIEDHGSKLENFVGCHLLKAVHFWNDTGQGKYDLFFLRDKDKNEVDFLVVENGKPWMLVEVKSSVKSSINKNLYYYQKLTNAPYAFQVVFDLPYVEKDCFTYNEPIIVPAKTFLSQLI